MTFNLDQFFERLKITAVSKTDENSLFELQNRQLRNIPFENLDCLHDRDISLDSAHLQNKLITLRRGGYCFELNQLLLEAMTKLGFSVRPLLSRVMYRGTGINPKTHIMLLVNHNQKKYLVDAGFGGPGLFNPIPMELDREDHQPHGTFKLVNDPEFGIILTKKSSDETWQRVYAFTEAAVYPADLQMSNFYTSKMPDSHFRHNLIAARFHENGRFTLLNTKFSDYKFNGEVNTVDIENESQLRNILSGHFQVNIPAEYTFNRFF